ncbi:hypothetical protein N7507_008509 [Penicillium longicatenatum]|nr:hypothetical protein N7507_008509 [Penicillium longicatenatum]
MDLYFAPEEAFLSHCVNTNFAPVKSYSPDSSNFPGEQYRPESMNLCQLSANESSPERMILCEFPEPQSARSTDGLFLPAEKYVPDKLDLSLLPAEMYELPRSGMFLLPAKTYEPESVDPFLLPARTYSPNSTSDYGCHVTPPMEDPNAHSSTWLRPTGPEDVADYQSLAECNPHLIDIDTEMADLMQGFMPIPLQSIDKIPDESSIRALLSPESCNPVFSNAALEIGTHKSLIPAALDLPVKRGPNNQPTLVNPGASKRPRSQAASLRSVNSTQGTNRLSATRHITSRLSARLSTRPNLSRQSSVLLLNGVDEFNDSARNLTVRNVESPKRKKLFGNDGWLGPHPSSVIQSPIFEPPPVPPLNPTPTSISRPALFRGLSKKFRKQVTNHDPKSPSKPFASSLMGTLKTNLQVSLKPTCQAKLYSDLEVMICTTANDFLLRQYYDGRISQYSVNKVLQQWGSKNRPQVYQFHFDQTTQRRLILENRRTLDFSGGCSTNAMQFHSSMQSWKAIATEMSARTFCLPDSAIRKNLFEIQQILDMLGAPVSTLRELNDLIAWAHSQMVEASELSRSSDQSQNRSYSHFA